jgi:hypothetical protein
MLRPSTLQTSMLLLTTLVLAFAPFLAAGHIIEVSAGKKECFFEDLHSNDKVPGSLPPRLCFRFLKRILDDCNISSRRWWTSRY